MVASRLFKTLELVLPMTYYGFHLSPKYVEVTGDTSIWEEEVGFLEDDPLGPDEQEHLRTPQTVVAKRPASSSTVGEPLSAALRFGEHGLPLWDR